MEWQIEIIQDNKRVFEKNDEVLIKRVPFYLRIILSPSMSPIPVLLNVLDNDNNFKLINPGMTLNWYDYIESFGHAFLPLKSMPLNTLDKGEELVVNDDAHHAITGDSSVYTRRISGIYLNEKKISVPIEKYLGEKLYLIFLFKYRADVINDDELKKLIFYFM